MKRLLILILRNWPFLIIPISQYACVASSANYEAANLLLKAEIGAIIITAFIMLSIWGTRKLADILEKK